MLRSKQTVNARIVLPKYSSIHHCINLFFLSSLCSTFKSFSIPLSNPFSVLLKIQYIIVFKWHHICCLCLPTTRRLLLSIPVFMVYLIRCVNLLFSPNTLYFTLGYIIGDLKHVCSSFDILHLFCFSDLFITCDFFLFIYNL